MKKSLVLLLLPTVLMCSCSHAAKYKTLKKREVLVVGDSYRFRNNESEVETDEIVSLPIGTINFSLNRSSYMNYGDEAYYNGYYYRLVKQNSTNNRSVNLGKKKVVTTVNYSYMPYGKDSMYVVVETTTRVKTTYSFKSHWEYCDVTASVNLNGYFSDMASFSTALPSLNEMYESYSEEKVYVSAVDKETENKSSHLYETYYYIERAK